MGFSNIWQGQELPRRTAISRPLDEVVHYRLYDQATGTLLSFNSTNSLGSIVADVAHTQGENPSARITVVRYDGPASP